MRQNKVNMSAKLSVLIALLGAAASAVAAPPAGASIWQGVYTKAQAARGASSYADQCARCHRDDLTGYNSVLIGDRFMQQWSEDSLNSFFSIVRQTMPRNAPSSLSDPVYLDIVAYVLQMNDFPDGQQELTADTVGSIRVESKGGPAPVPDFALVEVVGCLTQAPDKSWIVTKASEPVRTRNPNDSTDAELQAVRTKPFGTHTFHLLDFSGVQANPVNGQKVEVKGLLIRKPGDDRLNPSSVKPMAAGCTGQ